MARTGGGLPIMIAHCMNRESELPVPPPSFSNLGFVEEL
jgi:hypothetical protein